MVVVLGATAAKSLLGNDFRVTRHRGEVIERETSRGPRGFVPTVHPSSVLRAPDDQRDEAYARAGGRPAGGPAPARERRLRTAVSAVLWLLQIVLALVFLALGLLKVTRSRERLLTVAPWVEDYPEWAVTTIGVLELLGAAGVVLPAILGTWRPGWYRWPRRAWRSSWSGRW